MSYVIFARKYRPSNFEEMIGQKPVVQTLQNAIRKNRLAQAYIFSGMRGVGKTTAARILAKALNCQHGPTPTPCNKCEFCREINEDRAVDVLEIDGASNTSVEDVRSLQDGLKYKPIHSRYKVIIIDEVHMISKSAFNALLKTIEEPLPTTIFVFATTEFNKVPATIVSRCQHFDFKKISQKDIVNHLIDITKKEDITLSTFGLNLIAEASDGSLRDAQSLLDQAVAFSGENISDDDLREILGTVSRDLLSEFSSAIIQERPEAVFSLVEKVIENGHDIRYFNQELIRHFRNLLLTATIDDTQDLLQLGEEDRRRLEKEVDQVSPEEIHRYLTALQQAEQGLRYSSHPRIFFESLLIKLCHFKGLVPLDKLLAELEELRKDIVKNPLEKSPSLKSAEYTRKTVEQPQPEKPYSSPKIDEDPGMKPDRFPAAPADTNSDNLGKPAKKKPKEREVDIALKDPTVQNFMKTFKGQVLSVEPIKISEE